MEESRFEKFWPIILEHEGGLVDNKNDLGGVTKYGISLRYIIDEMIDINKDGKIDRNDIYAVTHEDAKEIYYELFYKRMRLEYIKNDALALELLDMGINAGFKTAIMLLQELLKTQRDGIIGYLTITGIDNYKGNIVKDYKNKRINYYKLIAERRPQNMVFLKGWLKRVDTTQLA